MWSGTLHFSVVGADKALSNSFGCYLQNGLSLWLCLTFDASLSYLLIFGTYDIRLIFPPCLPPLFAYYNVSLSPRVLFSRLSSPFVHLQADNLCFSWFLSIYSFILLIYVFVFEGKCGWRCSDSTLSKDSEDQAYSRIIIEMIEGTLGLWDLCSINNESLLWSSNICLRLSIWLLSVIIFSLLMRWFVYHLWEQIGNTTPLYSLSEQIILILLFVFIPAFLTRRGQPSD